MATQQAIRPDIREELQAGTLKLVNDLGYTVKRAYPSRMMKDWYGHAYLHQNFRVSHPEWPERYITVHKWLTGHTVRATVEGCYIIRTSTATGI